MGGHATIHGADAVNTRSGGGIKWIPIKVSADGALHTELSGTASGLVLPTANLNYNQWAMGDADTSITINAAANDDGNAMDLRRVDFDHASILLLVTVETGVVTSAAVTVQGSYDGLYTANEVFTTSALTELAGATVNAVGAYLYPLKDAEMAFMNYARINVAVTGGTSLAVKAYLMARGIS